MNQAIVNARLEAVAISQPPAALDALRFEMLDCIKKADDYSWDGGDKSSIGN